MSDTPLPDLVLHNTPQGRYLLYQGQDMINARLLEGQPWEPLTQLVAQMIANLSPMPVVVDIGANLGAFAVPLARHVKPRGGRLLAFEAQRLVYYQLCANLLVNGLENAYAHHLALGNQDGAIDVPILDLGRERNIGSLSLDPSIRRMQGTVSTLSQRSEAVAMRRLDGLGLPAASLVKIDVEGMELEVLEGAREWLSQSGHPPLLFEVWGDYLQGYREKKERLMRFVNETLGYAVELLGELAVAQHPERAMLRIEREGKQIRFSPMPGLDTARDKPARSSAS